MFRIAICDDDIKFCSNLEKTLQKINGGFAIDAYYNGEDLCRALANGQGYDLLFLDIELEAMNGVTAGRYIREYLRNEVIQIVYISAKREYAMELFEVRPLHFLLKPLATEKLRAVAAKAMALAGHEAWFHFRRGSAGEKIPLRDILYFTSDNRKIEIITMDGVETFYGKLSEVYAQTWQHRFLWIHKSYLVHYDYVVKFRYEEVEMANGDILPISQARRKDIRVEMMKLAKDDLL